MVYRLGRGGGNTNAHYSRTLLPQLRLHCCDKPGCGFIGMPAGELASHGLNRLFGDWLRRPGYPLLLPVQRVMCLSRFGRGQTPREDAVKGVSPQAPRARLAT